MWFSNEQTKCDTLTYLKKEPFTRTAINLPAITTTAGEMAKALEKLAGKAVADLIDWTPDPAIMNIVTSWPAKIDAARARKLGLLADDSFDAIVAEYQLENPTTAPLPHQL